MHFLDLSAREICVAIFAAQEFGDERRRGDRVQGGGGPRPLVIVQAFFGVVLSSVESNNIERIFPKRREEKAEKNYIETEMQTLIMTMEMHSSRMNIKELFQYDMLTFSLSISSFPPVCCRSRFRPLPHSQIRPSQLHPIPVEL